MYIESFHIIGLPPIILFGFFPILLIGAKLKLPTLRVSILYIWHTCFSIYYGFSVVDSGGDALYYYDEAGRVDFNAPFGNLGVIIPTAFFRYFFDLSFLEITLIFGMVGTIGLLFFDATLRFALKHSERWIKIFGNILIFLPSVSFWSAGLGKDPISFLSTCLCLWAALKIDKRYYYIIISLAIMFMVRPHVAGFMLMAFLVVMLMESRLPIAQKIIIFSFAFLVFVLMVPFVSAYVGVKDVVNIDSLGDYIEKRQSFNMEGGGGIDISNMWLHEQLFAYMFRPWLFDINSAFTAAAAFDNLILLILFVAGGWAMLKGRKSELGESRLFMWIYALSVWVLFAMTTANLGISLRQKWMFAPFLIFLFISVLGRRKRVKISVQNSSHAVHKSTAHASDRLRQY